MSVLYTRAILGLAAATADFPRLSAPDVEVRMRTPQCGSHIILGITVGDDDRISAVGMDIYACAVGQAAATLFARHAVGRSLGDVEAAGESLARWLSGLYPMPPHWPGIDELTPALDSQPRHAAVMLAFNAAVRALRDHDASVTGRLLDSAARAAGGNPA